jgi:uncharacterized low-complexity protein
MNTTQRKVVSTVGAFVLGSLATVSTANATGFQATELVAGYQLAAMEASCGADKAKTDDKAKAADKAKEGKCGEGKCGGDKAADKEKAKDTTEKATEGKCGEGKCGEGKCGGMN